MAGSSRKARVHTFEVLVSFSGLDKGDRFNQAESDMAWAMQHVETGYLRDVTEVAVEEVPDAGRSEIGQG